ncbi:hypothetical protein PAMA_018890 [Pampus argenteus]
MKTDKEEKVMITSTGVWSSSSTCLSVVVLSLQLSCSLLSFLFLKLKLKNEIHHLESELRKRDQLIEGFVSVAAAQSKHISHLQSSTFTAPPAPSPPSSMSPVVSDSATTLPWQATMHTGTSPLPARPEDHPCEKSCLSLDREPDVETVGTTRAAASSLDTSTLPLTTQTPSADPGAYSGHGTNTPVHTSTPNRANTCPRPSWTEVVRRGRRRVSAGRIHNRPWLSQTASPFSRRMLTSILTMHLQFPPHLPLKSLLQRLQRVMVRLLVAPLQ